MFIGRKKELAFFDKKFENEKGQLIVLYGRRRIGKTELLREFSRDKAHVFYSCTETTDEKQIENFSKRLFKLYKESEYLTSFVQWEEAFDYFLNSKVDGKKLLIIDEFPYMVRGNKSIPSILQNFWDETLKDENIMIVLCGSSMSFMEQEILGEKNPLYGRTTGIYKMNPLDFGDAKDFFGKYSIEEAITGYGILGGVPHYLNQFDDNQSIEENIKEVLLTKGGVLYNEVEFLMRQELRETQIYNTLISVIAMGSTKLNGIHQKTGIDKAKIGVYLSNLIDLGIIVREFPITETVKAKVNVQRGLYRIKDNFFKFWYRFLFPNISDLEEHEVDYVYEEFIEPFINEHTSYVFEGVCIEHLKKLNYDKKLPLRIRRIGRWWDKKNEIDIVGFNNHNEYILGECKWRNEVSGTKVLRDLEEKGEALKADRYIYYIFSKSGFSSGLMQEASARDDVFLITLDEMEQMYTYELL